MKKNMSSNKKDKDKFADSRRYLESKILITTSELNPLSNTIAAKFDLIKQ